MAFRDNLDDPFDSDELTNGDFNDIVDGAFGLYDDYKKLERAYHLASDSGAMKAVAKFLLPLLKYLLLGLVAALIGFSIWFVLDFCMWYGPQWEIEDFMIESEKNEVFYQEEFFNSFGFYYQEETDENGETKVSVIYKDADTGTVKKTSKLQFLQEAKNFYSYMMAGDLASDKNTLLMDDADMIMVLTYIINCEEKRKEHSTLTYEYVTSEFGKWADTGGGNLIPWDSMSEDEKNSGAVSPLYGWTGANGGLRPTDISTPETWDPENITGTWIKQKDSVTLYRNDIEGEKEDFVSIDDDGTSENITRAKFMTPWQTIMCMCSMVSNNRYEGEENQGWGYDDGTEQKDFLQRGSIDLDNYYLTDEDVVDILENTCYTFEFYTDMPETAMESEEWYQKFRKHAETGGFLSNIFDNFTSINIPFVNDRWEAICDGTWEIIGKILDTVANSVVQLYRADRHFVLTDISYEEMEKYSYRVEIDKPVNEEGDVAYIKKIPERAPKMISNLWEQYIYVYKDCEPHPDDPCETIYGSQVCYQRVHNLDGMAFYTYMKGICPDFEWDTFIYMLEEFPGAEAEVEKIKELKEVFDEQVATGIPYKTVEVEGGMDMSLYEGRPFYSFGVIIGKGSGITANTDGNAEFEWKPLPGAETLNEDYIYLNTDGISCAYPNKGWIAITDAAKQDDLRMSDGLTRDQVQQLLDYEWGRMPHGAECDIRQAGDAIYQWQESGGGSVTGIFAIMEQEGTLRSTYGWKYWNFGNYKAQAGEPVIPGSNNFKNFKAIYSTPAEALVKLFDSVSSRYWNNGQNTYYAMTFNMGGGTVYNAQTEEEAYGQTQGLTHCYCPYWDDNAVSATPTKEDKYYPIWCNNVARNRRALLSVVGK